MPQKLNEEKKNFLREMFMQFGNTKDFLKLAPLNSEELTVDNFIDHLNAKLKYFQNEKFLEIFQNHDQFLDLTTFKKKIDFISSHFYELDKKEIKKLEPNIIIDIISNDKLQIEDEDSLLNFILDVYT